MKIFMNTTRTEETIDKDGYRFVRRYLGNQCLSYESFNAAGILTSRVEYEWNSTVSALYPVKWTAFNADGKIENVCLNVGFDEKGVCKEVICYDATGKELYRRPS